MKILALYVGVPLVLLVGLLAFLFFSRTPGERKITPGARLSKENHLATVRQTLASQNDLGSCRNIIPQLNTHLEEAPEYAPRSLSAKEKESLREQLKLTPEELAELASPSFTLLDARYLADCFLFRDAARTLELVGPGGRAGKVKQTPLDRAEMAFAWAVRQVRLQPAFPAFTAGEPVPPGFALRRGWGSDLERALVFLAVLEQLGLEDDPPVPLRGALVFCPGADKKQRLWACGVTIGDKPEALYLFDPRLGLPLPGPKGKGIATLAQASSDRAVVEQLNLDKDHTYDVSFDQAKQAQVQIVCSLSAAAPRMELLQNRLLLDRSWKDAPLPPRVSVHLAGPPETALAVFRAAVKKSGGDPKSVGVWPLGGALLSRFLPKEEGGTDTSQQGFPMRALTGYTDPQDPGQVLRRRYNLYLLGAVPWPDFPQIFNKSRVFLPSSILGEQIRINFSNFFIRPLTDPASTRELILRGRYAKAAPELVLEQEDWQQKQGRLRVLRESGELNRILNVWAEQAVAAQAELERQKGKPGESEAKEKVLALWHGKESAPIQVLLQGAAAEARGAEVTFQLALCKHEEATRLQARKDLAARGGVHLPDDVKKLADAWQDAENFWKEYLDVYSKRPGAAAAQRWRGETLLMRGDVRGAIRLWKDLPAAKTDLDKQENLARLWLALQASR